ncbi:methyltransferase domain-containing protein [Thiotrichales bacterium 19S3-7]|nr:methyltransferase domain-containing protein [Thiotrichales bacterium 19S3-7]MCF6802443.1 methyltransferase domain-containing protein [Thiotrichales bacterium 19S3-11]
MDSWNSQTYSQFLELRTKPARDLISAIPSNFQPKTIYDLGCGPGNSTILLQERWPEANIIGIDSSLDMIKKAQQSYPNISFLEGDIASFSPNNKIDCFIANASLQWLDNHESLFPNLFNTLIPGGIFAIQMPNNFHNPTHQVIVKLLQRHSNWNFILERLRYGTLNKPFYNLIDYYDLLTNARVKSLACWETEYFQEMSDYPAIFNWVKGTALTPVLSAMKAQEKAEFEQAYISAITNAYPKQVNGKILLPFKRLFMVGMKST